MMDQMPEETMDRLATAIPMGELGQPLDIANAALYLACDESRYTTGTSLVVDGGYTI
jgi:NAD(P)-dependent dehydrogenase (short-subunit alcohol dehydrogenase family)